MGLKSERRGAARRGPTGMRLLLLLALAALTTVEARREGEKMVRKLEAPTVVDPRKDKFEMRCVYDLGKSKLDSVYWYKNGEAIFRYSPKLEPKGTVFPSDANVSLEQSDGQRLVLLGDQDYQKNIRAYEGSYGCEVSTEQPMTLDFAVANVSVAILPKKDPVIEGLAHNYQVGEHLDAQCTAAPSLPPAELAFYINGHKIDREHTHQRQNPIGGVAASTLSLSVRLERGHFPGGNLRLECRASLPGIDRDYRSVKTATLAASNQRLAQEPPHKSSAAAAAAAAAPLGLTLLLLALAAF